MSKKRSEVAFTHPRVKLCVNRCIGQLNASIEEGLSQLKAGKKSPASETYQRLIKGLGELRI